MKIREITRLIEADALAVPAGKTATRPAIAQKKFERFIRIKKEDIPRVLVRLMRNWYLSQTKIDIVFKIVIAYMLIMNVKEVWDEMRDPNSKLHSQVGSVTDLFLTIAQFFIIKNPYVMIVTFLYQINRDLYGEMYGQAKIDADGNLVMKDGETVKVPANFEFDMAENPAKTGEYVGAMYHDIADSIIEAIMNSSWYRKAKVNSTTGNPALDAVAGGNLGA